MNNIAFTHQGVEVTSATMVLPTYRSGPADPNPPLFGKGVRAIYPYPWRKSFTREIADRTYDALVLRSKWMELTFLPDWGFHLYRAVDRVTGRDLFHRPAVMKPAHNAIRGAYIAGGVEFNFPVGHNAMTCDRVGLHVRKTDEGVTVLFQDVERRSGMHWAAGVTLTSNFRGILFDQYFFNATPMPQPWYFWLNAGIAAHPSLRFIFPTPKMLGHFEGSFLETLGFYDFPVHNGVDYSRYAAIPEPIGLFSPSNYYGWFGAWYEDWNFGLARWAAPWQVGGQKLWSWGMSAEGLLWGKIAADQELPIPEIQSGRPETQMDRQIMRPYQSVSHREWWFPVSGTDGLLAAARAGAMNLVSRENRTCLKIAPAQAIADCRVQLNGAPVEGRWSLTPGQVCEVILPVPLAAINLVELQTPQADAILAWRRESAPLSANLGTIVDAMKPAAALSAEELFLKGFRAERTLRPDLARRFYRQALERDPGHADTRKHLGWLELMAERPAQALAELKQALQRNRWDEEALYLHGLAAFRTGAGAQARADWYRVAATGDRYVVPALLQLAEDSFRRGALDEARLILNDAGRRESDNAYRLFLLAHLARRQNQSEVLEKLCRDLDRVLGVSLMARLERCWAGLEDDMQRMPAGPETEDRLKLAAGFQYVALGLQPELLNLWNELQSPTVKTEMEYLVRQAGDSAFAVAEAPLIWAWGGVERLALEASLRVNPADAVAHFGLGCLLAESGQLESALCHLRQAAQRRPGDSVVRTALGCVLLECRNLEAAVAELEAAVQGRPDNPTAWVLLDQALGQVGKRNPAWLKRVKNAGAAVQSSDEFREAWARLAADLGCYDEAARVLAEHWFHPYELTHHLRNLWVRIHREHALTLAQAGKYDQAQQALEKALDYPENLQLGKPLRSFNARTLYTAGRIMVMAGKDNEAQAYYARAAAENQPGPTSAKPWAALAERKLGHPGLAQRRLIALEEEAMRYLAAEFASDLEDDLRRIVDLARRFQAHPEPSLAELLETE